MGKCDRRLHHDNAGAHSSCLGTVFIGITHVSQPPYNPDLALSLLLVLSTATVTDER